MSWSTSFFFCGSYHVEMKFSHSLRTLAEADSTGGGGGGGGGGGDGAGGAACLAGGGVGALFAGAGALFAAVRRFGGIRGEESGDERYVFVFFD